MEARTILARAAFNARRKRKRGAVVKTSSTSKTLSPSIIVGARREGLGNALATRARVHSVR